MDHLIIQTKHPNVICFMEMVEYTSTEGTSIFFLPVVVYADRQHQMPCICADRRYKQPPAPIDLY